MVPADATAFAIVRVLISFTCLSGQECTPGVRRQLLKGT